MPTSNVASNEGSYFGLLIMLILLQLATHLAPTQRPLGSTYIITKVFEVEDSMITIAKKNKGGEIVKVNYK
jgi:hypothetical protein